MPVTSIQADDFEQIQAVARQAGQVFRAGGLVIFPTETVYGVGASAASVPGLEALRKVKERPAGQPFTLHLPTPAAAQRYADVAASPVLRRLVGKVFPGPVTLIVDVSDEVIQDRLAALGLPPEARNRLYSGNTVGLRCPDHLLAQAILASVDDPIVASSANRRGQPAPHEAQEAAQALGDDAALVVDGGPARFAKASTILRVSGTGAQTRVSVERSGVYDQRMVDKLLRWTLLLVCSGNTCRSPMAWALARQWLARRRGVAEDELEAAGVRVLSAGVQAASGFSATDEACQAMSQIGLDLSRHRSRPLTHELIHEADMILCMTQAHRQTVISFSPFATDKTFLLDPEGQDLEDPMGMGLQAYRNCAQAIGRHLEQRLKEQEL